jgi:galactose mutarotase-like enzyme
MIEISNQYLSAGFTQKGGELRSLKTREKNTEMMWQADANWWNRTAPVLFPFVGKCKNNEYHYNGNTFSMSQHGFARDMDFEVVNLQSDSVVFQLRASDQTMQNYPFEFRLMLGYVLSGHRLQCSYYLQNTGHQNLFFSIGAHPGFRLFGSGLSEYSLTFNDISALNRWLLTDGLLNFETKELKLTSNKLHLSSSLFDDDAIVLKNTSISEVLLQHHHSQHSIKMSWGEFPFLGIWSKKQCESFICIEPWCGIADSINGQSDISLKEGIEMLTPMQRFNRSYTIEITEP